jgi:membrane protein DedA with SNARE-associated domain
MAAARFIQGLRQFNGIIAGISKMRWKKFVFFNLTGAALWIGMWIGAATILSSDKELLVGFIQKSEYILPAIFLTLF